jgi:RNA polymerase sigma-70 factor (ECF subfamily)
MMILAEPAPLPEINDVLVAAARSGDHAAIGAIGADAFRRIISFYRYTGVRSAQAEDLAADSVEQIVASLPTLKKVGSYDAWMWTIARNRLRSYWRIQQRGQPTEPVTPAPAGPDELAVIKEEHAEIMNALKTLSLRDRELLWLRAVLGLDYRTIATRVESNPASVRVACHRAKARLQNAYQSHGEG